MLSAAAGSTVCRLRQPTYTIVHEPPPFLDGCHRLSEELLPNHRQNPPRASSHAGPMSALRSRSYRPGMPDFAPGPNTATPRSYCSRSEGGRSRKMWISVPWIAFFASKGAAATVRYTSSSDLMASAAAPDRITAYPGMASGSTESRTHSVAPCAILLPNLGAACDLCWERRTVCEECCALAGRRRRGDSTTARRRSLPP